MPIARAATAADLEPLLDLFRVSEVGSTVEPLERAEPVWRQMLSHDGVTVFVSETNAKIVATCTLITTPNLLRSGQGHAFLENVVTDPSFKGQGYGRAVVEAALSKAWATDCYQVLLQSDREDPRVHRFYERCGFEPRSRTAYVAHRHAKWQRPLLAYFPRGDAERSSDGVHLTHGNRMLSSRTLERVRSSDWGRRMLVAARCSLMRARQSDWIGRWSRYLRGVMR